MAEAIAVSGFNIPPVPAGAQVNEHSREAAPVAPSPAARQTFQQPAQLEFQSILPQNQPQEQQPAQAPASDATLQALLAALTGAKPAPQPAPVQQSNLPAAVGGDGVTVGLTNILASSGLDVNRAIGNALTHGDASLVDAAYIKEAGGAQAAHLLAVATGLIEHATRAEAALAQSVYAASGGEQNWRAALGAFEASAPGHLQAVVRTLYDSKDPSNVDAATKTILEFAKQAGAIITPAGLLTADAAGGSVQALDKAGFQAEMQKLDKNARGYEQARAELFVRRHAGKQLGR
jgi:hypothetical protein